MSTLDYDVVILGAGAAGLAAARELRRNGVNFAVLEARNWVGGRIWTQEAPEAKTFELGAEFVHGKSEALWKLLDEARIRAYDIDDTHTMFRRGKFEPYKDFWRDLEKSLKKTRGHRKHDRSFGEFIRHAWLKPELKELAISFIEGFDAAPVEGISERSVAETEEYIEKAEGTYRIIGGFDKLMNWLATPLRESDRLFLNTRVTRVRWKKGSAEVYTESRSGEFPRIFRAKQLIITAPIGVLKSGDLRFEPDVFDSSTPKGSALGLLHSGPVTKVILEFKERFWEKSKSHPKLGFVHSRELDLGTWWGSLPLHLPLLTGWAGGPMAEKLSRLGDGQLLDRALTSLAQILGVTTERLRDLLKAFHYHNWQTDPFSRGAYSYAGVGGAGAPSELATPVDDTLFFAGEATHTQGMSGTVDGAITTGQRAAKEVLEAKLRREKVAA